MAGFDILVKDILENRKRLKRFVTLTKDCKIPCVAKTSAFNTPSAHCRGRATDPRRLINIGIPWQRSILNYPFLVILYSGRQWKLTTQEIIHTFLYLSTLWNTHIRLITFTKTKQVLAFQEQNHVEIKIGSDSLQSQLETTQGQIQMRGLQRKGSSKRLQSFMGLADGLRCCMAVPTNGG